MLKFAYTFLILHLFFSSLHAFYLDGEEERKGQVFPTQTYIVKKEKDEEGNIRHSPKDPTLTAATIRYLYDGGLLHFNYFEIMSNGDRVFSHTVTPNVTRLTKDSTTFDGLFQNVYASIPVRFNKNSEIIELLIFGASLSATDDYALTIAAGLELLLTEFIPSIVNTNKLPLKSVIIKDDNHDLQTICFDDRFKYYSIGSRYTVASRLPIQPNVNNYWELTLNFTQPSF